MPPTANAAGPVTRRASSLDAVVRGTAPDATVSDRMAAVKSPQPRVATTVTEEPGSRVKVEAEVSWPEVQARMNEAASRMGRSLRIPGFRAGKVPPGMVIQRYGQEAVLDEAIRSSIGRWFSEALEATVNHPVGEPELEIGPQPQSGQPVTFSFTIGVRPPAQLGDLSQLAVERREPAADPEIVDEQIETMRRQLSRLETTERAAGDGDFVVIDFKGFTGEGDAREAFEGGEGRDHLLELGGGRFIPGFEEQLVGLSAGDDKTVTVTFPEDYPAAPHLAGRPAEFEVTVHEVKERKLPELDDDFAAEAGGFDTLAELREDLERRAVEQDEQRVEAEFREAVLDAAVAASKVEVPDALAEARARELFEQMLHSLAHRGMSREAYLRMAGQTEEELLAEAVPDAAKALRREAVLAAFVEAERIEPSDGDVLDALQGPAAQQQTSPEKLRKQLEKSGRLDELIEDLSQRRAVELLAERASGADAD